MNLDSLTTRHDFTVDSQPECRLTVDSSIMRGNLGSIMSLVVLTPGTELDRSCAALRDRTRQHYGTKRDNCSCSTGMLAQKLSQWTHMHKTRKSQHRHARLRHCRSASNCSSSCSCSALVARATAASSCARRVSAFNLATWPWRSVARLCKLYSPGHVSLACVHILTRFDCTAITPW